MFACPSCATPVASGRARVPAVRLRARHRRQPDRHGAPPGPLSKTPSGRQAANALERRGGKLPGRALRAGDRAGRPLPHRRPDRPRRDGRGLPRGRPAARAAGRAQVPAARARRRRRAPRALLPRGARRAPGLAPGGVPRLRRRRGRGPLLPLDGARRRREPRLAAAAHRAAAARQGARDRAPALRGPRRRAREGRAAPRPQARQRDARRPGQRAHHRLRARRPRRDALAATTCARGRRATCRPSSCWAARSRVRSDIYSLGLVLYELYTGRRAFEGKSLAEYTRKHRDERPIEPSALVAGLDPAVERAILGCLEKEPRRRPVLAARRLRDAHRQRSARGGARGGGDALARARRRGGRVGGAAAGVGLGPARAHARRPRAGAARRQHVPAAREGAGGQAAGGARGPRARFHPARRASGDASTDDAWGLGADWGYTGHIREKDSSPGRWDDLATGNPPVLQFWYRQSPRPIVSMQPSGKIYWGEARARGQRHGRASSTTWRGGCCSFYAVPPQLETEARGTGRGARLGAALRRGAPRPGFVPSGGAALDALLLRRTRARPGRARGRAGPTSPCGSRPRPTAGARRGSRSSGRGRGRSAWRPTPWPTAKILRQALFLTLVLLLLGAAGFMARRNLVLGRGDRRGAFRVALLLAGVGLLVVGARRAQRGRLERAGRPRLARGRRRRARGRPSSGSCTSRSSRTRGASAPGRSCPGRASSAAASRTPWWAATSLAGVAWAILVYFLNTLRYVVPPRLGQPAPEPSYSYLDALLGPGTAAVGGAQAGERLHPLSRSASLLLFVLLRMLLRRDALAMAALAVVLIGPNGFSMGESAWLGGADLRRGDGDLDPAAAALRAARGVDRRVRLRPCSTSSRSRPTSPRGRRAPTLLALPLLALLCVFACRNSLGGTGLRRYLAPEPSSRP